MHAAKVEIAFGRNVGDVCRDPAFFAQLPHLCGCLGIINGTENHIGIIEIARLEITIDMSHLLLSNPISDFFVQTRFGTYDGHAGVRIESIQYSTRSDLKALSMRCQTNPPRSKAALRLAITTEEDRRRITHLSAANDKDVFVFDLPRNNQRASSLNFGEFRSHLGRSNPLLRADEDKWASNGDKNGCSFYQAGGRREIHVWDRAQTITPTSSLFFLRSRFSSFSSLIHVPSPSPNPYSESLKMPTVFDQTCSCLT